MLKPLKHNPVMYMKVINKIGEPIKAEINKALEEVKTEHPEIEQMYSNAERERSVSSSDS